MATTISFEEATGAPPPSAGPKPVPPGTRYSFDQAVKTSTAESPQENLLSRTKDAPREWIDRFREHVDTAQKASSKLFAKAGEDFSVSERDPALGMKSAGEALLACMNWLWGSTGGALYETIVGDPITQVSKKIPTFDDLHPIDTKTHQFRDESTSKPWQITRGDVDRTTAAINEFGETAVGLVGPGGVTKPLSPAALELLSPEARTAYLARQSAKPAKLEGAFDTLISKSPDGALQVAEEIGKISPETEKYLKKRWQKYIDASEHELNYIGREAAKANLAEMEGKMPRDYSQYEGYGLNAGEGHAPGKGPRRGPKPSGIDPLIPPEQAEPPPEGLSTGEGKPPGARKRATPSDGGSFLLPPIQRDSLGTPLNVGDRPTRETTPLDGAPPRDAPPLSAPRAPLLSAEQFGGIVREATRDMYGSLENPTGLQDMSLPKEQRAIIREGVAARRAGDKDIEGPPIKFPRDVKPGSTKDFANEVTEGTGTTKIKDQLSDPKKFASYLSKNAGVAEAWDLNYLRSNWKANVKHAGDRYSYPWQVELPWKTHNFKTEMEARRFARDEQALIDKRVKHVAEERKAKGIPDNQSVTEFNNNKRNPEMRLHNDFPETIEDDPYAWINSWMDSSYDKLAEAKPLPGHPKNSKPFVSHERLLNKMQGYLDKIRNPEDRAFFKDLTDKLLEVLPAKTRIIFTNEPLISNGNEVGGLYKMLTGDVYISTRSPYTTQIIIHELVHAATANFLDDFPNHPLTKEMTRLYEVSRERLRRFDKENKLAGKERVGDIPYGFKNVKEFVAEAFSNKKFQKVLKESEVFAHEGEGLNPVNIWYTLVDTVRKMLGMKGYQEARLLENVIKTGTDIMDLKMGRYGSELPHDTEIFSPPIKGATRNRAVAMATGKLAEYYDQMLRTFHPEGRGGDAGKQSGAVIASNISKQMQADTWQITRAKERLKFWDKNKNLAESFIKQFERGAKFADAKMQQIADGYRAWGAEIFAQDKRNGIVYEPIDHYLPHVFKDPQKVITWLDNKYGKGKWSKPGFAKDRGFDLYEEAVNAGHTPKFTNPEDIFLARQHASDVAEAKINILKDLEKAGLAVKKGKNSVAPSGWQGAASRPSPDGSSYWVHDSAAGILHNVYDTTSLWESRGMGGDAFRGAMFLKNAIVPVKLAFSLFHPLHVATIDNATGAVRGFKSMLSGSTNPLKSGFDVLRALSYYDTLKQTAATLPLVDIQGSGNRLLRLMQGKIPDHLITNTDRLAMQYMNDGGFTPAISSQYKLTAIENMQRAINQHSLRAFYHLPFAVLQGMARPIFESWIPSLKAASYLADAKTAIEADPTLIGDPLKRQVVFRKIAKSVDNRYGEMQYGTLFWNRTVKDLAVLNTLSLGWTLGFVREYGGGVMDAGQALTQRGGLAKKVAEGKLDRPMFATIYTMQALVYGGLLTYWMSGKIPQSWEDYVYPQTGQTNPDGKPERVNTMFYTREFGGAYKRGQAEGPLSALSEIVDSKSSGIIGMAWQGIRGVNSMGDQVRDPYAPFFTQVEQTVAAGMQDTEPMSMVMLSKGKNPLQVEWWKQQFVEPKGFRSKLGLAQAPQYANKSKVENEIDAIYKREYTQKETPYDKAQQSKAVRELKQMYKDGDEGFQDKLAEVREQYKLNAKEVKAIATSVRRDISPSIYKFEKFSPNEQRHILDQMDDEDRQKFLRHASKKLRYTYSAPETAQ